MDALIGILRPGEGESNRAWVESVLTWLRTPLSPGAVSIHDESESDLIVVTRRDAVGGSSRGRSSTGATFAWVTGRIDGSVRSAIEVADRFETEGVGLFQEAIGPYISVVTTGRGDRLTIVRGLCGQRAVFYAELPGGGIAFATDASWLSLHPLVGFELDEIAVADFLSFGVIWGDRTLLRDIRRLMPGTSCTHDRATGRIVAEPYGRLPRGDEIADEGEALEVLDGALAEAMRRSVSGPLSTALCLSAGLDSRTLLAVAARHGIELDCITSGIRGGIEFRLTRQMCDVIGARHMECLFDDAFLADLERFATRIARSTNGEADFMNTMMLHQGIEYRKQFDLTSVIRGHGGELMKLSNAYGFSVTPELAVSDRHAIAKAQIVRQVGGSAGFDGLSGLFRGALAETLPDSPTRSFEQNYDSVADGAANVGQAVSLMFLTRYNGRHTVNAVRCMMEAVDVAQPILDEDVARALLSMPIRMRTGTQLQIELIRRNHAPLLRVPNSALGVSLTASPNTVKFARLLLRIRRRLGFGQEDVPEEWLITRMGGLFASILLDEQSLSRPYLDPDVLRSGVERSRRGERSVNTLLGRLMILELMLRNRPTSPDLEN